jgi:hypothetical protein
MHVHELLLADDETPMAALFNTIWGLLGATTAAPFGTLLDAARADIKTANRSKRAADRFWAAAITASAPSGAAFNSDAAVSDIDLDPIQTVLILTRLLASAASSVPASQRPAGVPAWHATNADFVAQAPLDAPPGPSSGCEGTDDVKRWVQEELPGYVSAGVNELLSAVAEALEERWREVKGDHSSAPGPWEVAAATWEAVWPLYQIYLSKAMFRAKISQAPDPLVRTKSNADSAKGNTAKLTAKLSFGFPDKDHTAECLKILLAFIGVDLDVPSDNAIPNVAVTWDLIEGGTNGERAGYVAICPTECGEVHDTRATKDGITTEAFIGLRQQVNLQRANYKWDRTALARLSINPNDIEDAWDNMVKSLQSAVQTALGYKNPAGVISKVALREFQDMGYLGIRAKLAVQDWRALPKTIDVRASGITEPVDLGEAVNLHLVFAQASACLPTQGQCAYKLQSSSGTLRGSAFCNDSHFVVRKTVPPWQATLGDVTMILKQPVEPNGSVMPGTGRFEIAWEGQPRFTSVCAALRRAIVGDGTAHLYTEGAKSDDFTEAGLHISITYKYN